MKTLIAGLGNPILGDDGVGWVVARQLAESLGSSNPSVKVESFALAGISLMEQMVGFDRVILIDSLNTGKYIQGEVVTFTLDSLVDLTFGHSASAHDLSLKKALEMGRYLDADLPDDKDVYIIAIEAQHVFEFCETLTPEIEAAVPLAVLEALKVLEIKNFEQKE
jgi:hydrogenase maturation protease